MKHFFRLYLFILPAFLLSSSGYAQTVFWEEDFEDEAGGATIGNNDNNLSGADWTTQYNGSGTFSVQGNEFRAQNTGTEAVWTSEVIDISAYHYVEFSIDAIWAMSNFFSGNDYIRIYYKLNGDSELLYFEEVSKFATVDEQTLNIRKILSGANVQIIIKVLNDVNLLQDDIIIFDNIQLSEVPILYAMKNGNWNNGSTWSADDYTETQVSCECTPTASETVAIGNGFTVAMNGDGTTSGILIENNAKLNYVSNANLNITRGGNVLLKTGSKILKNGYNSSTIEFVDPFSVNLVVDDKEGINVGKLILYNNVNLLLSGAGSAKTHHINFIGSNSSFNIQNIPFTISGDINASGNNKIINSTNGVINWSGNSWSNRVRLFSGASGAMFNYDGANDQLIVAPQDAYNSLTLSGAGTKTALNNFTINNDLSITGNATFDIENKDLTIQGDWNNLSNTANSFDEGVGKVMFMGNTDQTITNNSGSETFYELEVNKSGGDLILGNNVRVEKTMSFKNGVVRTTKNKLLIFADGAISSTPGLSSYVNGPVSKFGNQNFTFPIGSDGVLAPIAISDINNGSSATQFIAEYFHQSAPNPSNLPEANLVYVSGIEYWDLHKESNDNAEAKVELMITEMGKSDIYDMITGEQDAVIAHFNDDTNTWERFEVTSWNIGSLFKSIKTTAWITSFSPFTFGSSGGISPLPVELISFNVEKKKVGNMLFWETASETENDFFLIEKSKDGKEWEGLTKVEGNGNSSSLLKYNFIDMAPFYGVTFYRLKQVDFNGNFQYSKIIAVNSRKLPTFELHKLYPNPTTGTISIGFVSPGAGDVWVNINNLQGQEQMNRKFTIGSGYQEMSLDLSKLSKGIYFIILQQNDQKISKKIIRE